MNLRPGDMVRVTFDNVYGLYKGSSFNNKFEPRRELLYTSRFDYPGDFLKIEEHGIVLATGKRADDDSDHILCMFGTDIGMIERHFLLRIDP